MSKEAMQQALEALESDPISHAGLVSRKQAITALRQALETEQESICAHGVEKTKCDFCQPKQEPVAHIDHRIHGWPDCFVIRADPPHTSPLYLSLPKREWVGLTEEDMEALFLNEDGVRFARYIEAKLREKNA